MTSSGICVCPCCEKEFGSTEEFRDHLDPCLGSSEAANRSHIGEWLFAVRPRGGGTVGRIRGATAMAFLVDAFGLDVSEDGDRTLTTCDYVPSGDVDRFLTPEEGKCIARGWLESFVAGMGCRGRTSSARIAGRSSSGQGSSVAFTLCADS